MSTKYIVKHLSGTFLYFAIIFISAGRLNYTQGLIYLAIGVVMSILSYTLLKTDPELIRERSQPGEGTRKWDKVILLLSFGTTVAMYVIAGLDSGRYHWSPDFHPGCLITGILLTITGQLLFLIAQHQNRFFSSMVRIQSDRGHTVYDAGLYKIVRHPAYLGSVIQAVGFPLLFASLWSIIPVCVLIILLISRTILEDNMLIAELEGYREYAAKTRFKMIPCIW